MDPAAAHDWINAYSYMLPDGSINVPVLEEAHRLYEHYLYCVRMKFIEERERARGGPFDWVSPLCPPTPKRSPVKRKSTKDAWKATLDTLPPLPGDEDVHGENAENAPIKA